MRFLEDEDLEGINVANLLFILISSFLAAAISGAAGFGGALLLLPLLS